MNTLSKLFGSELRVRLMRMFLFNPDCAFDMDHISEKTGEKARSVEKEIMALRKMGMIKPDKLSKVVIVRKATKNKKAIERKRVFKAWSLDNSFPLTNALADFLIRTHSLERKSLVKRLEKAGRIKAVLVAGIFTQDSESRMDLFVVGDNIKTSSIDRIVKSMESDMGRDIRYAALSMPDFAYRVSMNDKLVRDVLDFPYEAIVDKIGISRSK